MTDPTVGARALHRREPAEVEHLLPTLAGQGVQQVEVHVVGLETPELLVEQPLPVLLLLDEPDRGLGGEADAVPQPAGEGPSDERLARSGVVGIGRVHVVHAAVDRPRDKRRRAFLVDARHVAADRRQTHAAEAEDRHGFAGNLGEGAGLHGRLSAAGRAARTFYAAPRLRPRASARRAPAVPPRRVGAAGREARRAAPGYPLTTANGRIRATGAASPAPATARTTSCTSL